MFEGIRMKIEQTQINRETPEYWSTQIKKIERLLDIVWSRGLSRWCVVRKPQEDGFLISENDEERPEFRANICILVYETDDGEMKELSEDILVMIRSMDCARFGNLTDHRRELAAAMEARQKYHDEKGRKEIRAIVEDMGPAMKRFVRRQCT